MLIMKILGKKCIALFTSLNTRSYTVFVCIRCPDPDSKKMSGWTILVLIGCYKISFGGLFPSELYRKFSSFLSGRGGGGEGGPTRCCGPPT
jgi:hypothetical protein